MSTQELFQVLSKIENSEMFNSLYETVKIWTYGCLNLKALISACVGLNMAGKMFPSTQSIVFDQMKATSFSSLTVSSSDHLLREGLLQFARTTSYATGKP